jgi:hypothetical protein
MNRLTHAPKAPDVDDVERQHGGFNDFPDNWRELTEAEFARAGFWSYQPRFIETRQMMTGRGPGGGTPAAMEKGMIPATLFHYGDGTGHAIRTDYWEKRVRFYAFGCAHKWQEIGSAGHCLHRMKCDACGRTQVIDSSD